MASLAEHTTETGVTMAAKAAPSVTVSLATIAGVQVSDILLWATLIYTILMITHKLYTMYKDFKSGTNSG